MLPSFHFSHSVFILSRVNINIGLSVEFLRKLKNWSGSKGDKNKHDWMRRTIDGDVIGWDNRKRIIHN